MRDMKFYRQEKGSYRNQSEEIKGFGPRFEMESGLLTRLNNCMKEESLHGAEIKDLSHTFSTSCSPPSATERRFVAFGAGVCGIEISIYSYK